MTTRWILTYGTTDGKAHRKVFRSYETRSRALDRLVKRKDYVRNSASLFLEFPDKKPTKGRSAN